MLYTNQSYIFFEIKSFPNNLCIVNIDASLKYGKKPIKTSVEKLKVVEKHYDVSTILQVNPIIEVRQLGRYIYGQYLSLRV